MPEEGEGRPREAAGGDEDLEAYRKRKMGALDKEALGRAGGVYVPPFKLQRMQEEPDDKTGDAYQRITWEALRKSINGLVNKVNTDNITRLCLQLLEENLVRGRGLFCRAVIRAQMASPTFTNVYACLVALVNSKLPDIGELVLKRVILQFRRAYKRNDKIVCLAAVKFIGHLFNQKVVSEYLPLQVALLLLEQVTDDSVEVCCGFIQECGEIMGEVSPQSQRAIFARLRVILQEGQCAQRTQYVIEGTMNVLKTKFRDYKGLEEGLDLLEEEDQITHEIDLIAKDLKGEEMLNVFKAQPPEDFERDEKAWVKISAELLGKDESEDSGDSSSDGSSSDSEAEEKQAEKKTVNIIDNTGQDTVNLRRNIYLVIQSSMNFEECCHKLLKMNLKDGDEIEVVTMLLDCCAMQKSFTNYYSLMGERLARLKPETYGPLLDSAFCKQIESAHRLETNKLRNLSKFFAHLLYTDAISWALLAHLELTEQKTTSSSRIFIKVMFQDLSENMGGKKLKERMQDPDLQPFLNGLFPRNTAKDLRFCINFFSAIGLGHLTEELRELLNSSQMLTKARLEAHAAAMSTSSSSSSSSSSSDSSSSSSSSDSSSDGGKKKKKR